MEWQQRATVISELPVSVDPADCVFDVSISARGWGEIVALFYRPDTCIHSDGCVYRLSIQDFARFESLAHDAIAECAAIGNFANGGMHMPNHILRVVNRIHESSDGTTADFDEAQYYAFRPPGLTSAEVGASPPELHALTAMLSLVCVGPKGSTTQEGSIQTIRKLWENTVFIDLRKRLAQDEAEQEAEDG
jgi:hypothetical protein